MIKKLRDMFYYIIGLLFFIIIIFYIYTNFYKSPSIKESNGKLIVNFLDVDQGDATFIELPNGQIILLDGGEYKYRFKVHSFIKEKSYKKIDYLIATHPHSDHIGSLSYIVDKFDVTNIYMPNIDNDIPSYNYLMQSINKKKIQPTVAKGNDIIIEEDNLKVYFVSPNKEYYEEINGYSLVLKIEYGDTSFLFMADALKENELEIMGVTADVVKVGHHGAFSSSTIEFVNKVKAKYAIISVGNNDYNLPRIDIINRWERSGSTVYRTDECGNISIISDGNSLNVEFEDNKKLTN